MSMNMAIYKGPVKNGGIGTIKNADGSTLIGAGMGVLRLPDGRARATGYGLQPSRDLTVTLTVGMDADGSPDAGWGNSLGMAGPYGSGQGRAIR